MTATTGLPISDKTRDDIRFASAMIRINAAFASPSDTIIDRKWQWRRLTMRIRWRRRSALMGRFGGGWNWNLGVQWGSSTVILNLLILALTFSVRDKVKP